MIPASPLVVSTVRHTAGIVTQLLGLAALAALLAAGAAVLARYETDQRVPRWLAVLVGLVPVIVYLATTPALESILREGLDPTEVEVGLFNLGGVLAGAGGALVGRRVGDQFCTEVLFWTPTQDVDGEVGQLAQTVGQVTNVRLPPSIDDAVGYDPVPERTKEALAGTTFVFPRTLTTAELEARLAERLKTDYGVETVDAEFDGDEVRYLAVGRRAAGIGSTLPAATNAVAVRADPAFSASTGDIVQVWEPERMRRVLTGELRGVADDVVTVAIDATDTPKVDPRKRYRLVTLPVEDRPDREFASLLRAAAETFSSAAVEAGSPLHGMPVGALDLTVVAVRPEEAEPVVFPEGSYRLGPGDRLFVIGTATQLRRLDRAGEALDPSVAGPPPSTAADDSTPVEGIETAELSPTDPDEQSPDEPARIGSDTGIERDDPSHGSAPAGSSDAGDSRVEGKADEATFEEIKAEFDEGEQSGGDPVEASSADPVGEADPAETPDSTAAAETESEPVEASAADSGEATDIEPDTASFEDLRDEFESGEADWDDEDDDPFEDVEIAFEDEDESEDDEDDLVSLDEAEIDFEDEADDGTDETVEDDPEDEGEDDLVSLDEAEIAFEDEGADDEGTDSDLAADESVLGDPEIDDDLQGESEESLAGDLSDLDVDADEEDTDDLSDLEFEEDEDDGIFADESLEDDSVFGEDDAEDDDTEDDDDDDGESGASDDDDDDGGGKSFAELKEEFESGDAEWEEDVSDSPGGDMRLDE